MTNDPESSAPSSAWERLRATVLAANLVWTTLSLGGILPGSRVPTCVLTALLVLAHFLDPSAGRRAHPAGWLFLPFLAYAAANIALISPVPWIGWPDWINWAQAVAVFWVVLNGIGSPLLRARLFGVLAALGVCSALMALYQHFIDPKWIMLGRTQADQFLGRSAGPFGVPNSLGVFMAVLIPPVGFLAFQRGSPVRLRSAWIAVLVFLGVGFVLAISRGAWISLVAAFSLRIAFGGGRSIAKRVTGLATVLGAAAAAATTLYFAFPLMRERLQYLVRDLGEHSRPILWRAAWRIFEAHPAFGGGGGCFNTLFEAHRPEGFVDEPVYAHCDYLNTLCDYGAVGFVLLFGAAAVVALKAARARGLAGAAFTGLLAFALHLLVDFHLKIPALALVFASVAAVVTREAWPDSPGKAKAGTARSRVLSWATALAVAVATLFVVVPRYRAEEFRRVAREKINKIAKTGDDASTKRAELVSILKGLDESVSLDPSNAQAWSDRAYAESLWAYVEPARTEELGTKVCADASRALDRSKVVPEFWIRMGTGLDMQRRWAQGGDCFATALALAPVRADIWYYQAYHLSLSSVEAGPALAAADFCLRLDPDFLLAQTLRQRLAVRQQSSP